MRTMNAPEGRAGFGPKAQQVQSTHSFLVRLFACAFVHWFSENRVEVQDVASMELACKGGRADQEPHCVGAEVCQLLGTLRGA